MQAVTVAGQGNGVRDAPDPWTARFGPLLPKRDCDDCTACCTVPAIAELDKPQDTRCGHCVMEGCGIYDRRPVACRTFFCGWRRLAWLPGNLRPDRCGAIVMLELAPNAPNPFDRKCIVIRGIDQDPRNDPALLKRIVGLLGRRPIPVFVSAPGSSSKHLIHPRPEIYWQIVEGTVVGQGSNDVERWRLALDN